MSAIRQSIETITPDMARRYLDKNTVNRPLSESYVSTLAGAIDRGEWELNGDSIRFDHEERLLDGQHRLTAIIDSGKPIVTLVVRGLSINTFDTIDQGFKRTAGHVFSIRGVKNYNAVAAAARSLYKYLHFGNPYTTGPGTTPTIKQLEGILKEYSGLEEYSTEMLQLKWCKKYLGPSLPLFCRVIFEKRGSETSRTFFEKLNGGTNLDIDSPILLLRDRLVDEAKARTSLKTGYKVALIFKAFKLYSENKKVRTLKIIKDGDNTEKDIFIL